MLRLWIAPSSGVVVMALLVPSPARAQDDAHCFVYDAPDTAVSSRTVNLAGFKDALQIAALRHACNLDTGADKALLDRQVAAAGCPATSEVAALAASAFAATPAEALAILRRETGADSARLTRLCQVAATCVVGELTYEPDCEINIARVLAGGQ